MVNVHATGTWQDEENYYQKKKILGLKFCFCLCLYLFIRTFLANFVEIIKILIVVIIVENISDR